MFHTKDVPVMYRNITDQNFFSFLFKSFLKILLKMLYFFHSWLNLRRNDGEAVNFNFPMFAIFEDMLEEFNNLRHQHWNSIPIWNYFTVFSSDKVLNKMLEDVRTRTRDVSTKHAKRVRPVDPSAHTRSISRPDLAGLPGLQITRKNPIQIFCKYLL